MSGLNEDGYIDILEERRNASDVGFAYRKWNGLPCQYSKNRNPEEIKNQVLVSNRVQNAIKEVSRKNGQPIEEIEKRALEIVTEMAHDFDFRIIRFFSFALTKFFKQVYNGIFVNQSGIEKIAKISNQYPILYLPTHRSYADFLLVSYICYRFHLPVPVIASGLDFLGMKFINCLLRKSGAFFIRRSFIDDHLYWEVFSEYVKSHITGCELPIEFFIEGTRSRTAKSLVPKTGMLQAILEEYFCSRMPDITVVPISMSYDRTLEETLYAYELLGVPKPKESTRGLFKARKILSTNFNNVYVHFGDPISCKEFFKEHFRSMHNLSPRSICSINKKEQLLCQDLANYVVYSHQKNLMLSPFPLICLIIGHPWYSCADEIQFTHLMGVVTWLERFINKTGASIYLGQMDLTEAVVSHIKVHSNIIDLTPDFVIVMKFLAKGEETSVKSLQEKTLKYALPSMFLYHYGNQVLQLLIHFCLICVALECKLDTLHQVSQVYFNYKCLRRLLRREFVFGRENAEIDFHNGIQALKEEGLIEIYDSTIVLLKGSSEKMNFLRELPLYFLESYYTICLNLLSMEWTGNEKYNCQKLAQHCQVAIEKALNDGKISDYKCLSLDIINNCISLLVTEKALIKEKKNGQIIVIPRPSEIKTMLDNMKMFLPSGEQTSVVTPLYPYVSSKL